MESDELRFRHVGISSDGAVVPCDMDNGRTYSMPLWALEWQPVYRRCRRQRHYLNTTP